MPTFYLRKKVNTQINLKLSHLYIKFHKKFKLLFIQLKEAFGVQYCQRLTYFLVVESALVSNIASFLAIYPGNSDTVEFLDALWDPTEIYNNVVWYPTSKIIKWDPTKNK